MRVRRSAGRRPTSDSALVSPACREAGRGARPAAAGRKTAMAAANYYTLLGDSDEAPAKLGMQTGRGKRPVGAEMPGSKWWDEEAR